jgi:hypothetical protein
MKTAGGWRGDEEAVTKAKKKAEARKQYLRKDWIVVGTVGCCYLLVCSSKVQRRGVSVSAH